MKRKAEAGGGSSKESLPTQKRAPSDTDGGGEATSPKPVKIAPIFGQSSLLQGRWEVIPGELMIFTPTLLEHRSKIAAFDLDGTLIRTKSGAVFPKDADDWNLWTPGSLIPRALRSLHDEQGFKLCIFTNQKGLQKEKSRISAAQFQTKIRRVLQALGSLPIQVFISLGSPNFRKPYSGMWDHLLDSENGGVSVDVSASFFVGDAAGRISAGSTSTPRKGGLKGDHSCADRLFALNCSLQFYTPEQFFLKQSAEEAFKLPEFSSQQFLSTCLSQSFSLIMVGPPACGKSTFAKKLKETALREHPKLDVMIVNQDQLKTKEACLSVARRALEKSRSFAPLQQESNVSSNQPHSNNVCIVVDATNRDRRTREDWWRLAKEFNAVCRCLVFNCSQALAMHNNRFRQILGTDSCHKKVDDHVIRLFFISQQPPISDDEMDSFHDVIHFNFVPEFESDRERRIYSQHLLEQ